MFTDIALKYLAMRIGPAHFDPPKGGIFILALTTALIAAYNLWRIGRREDRIRRFGTPYSPSPSPPDISQTRPSSWLERLGTVLARTRVISVAKRERLLGALSAAGLKGPGRLNALVASKVCLAAVSLAVFWALLKGHAPFTAPTFLEGTALAGAIILGWQFPEVCLARLAARRRARLEVGLPDALDLLVICSEAGLSLDQAMETVGRELRITQREIADELAITVDEMRVLADRRHALENLAQRAGLLSLRGIIATMNQSVNFGTPLAGSLRALASEMRKERLVRIEERAARLPVLLTIPLMVFILPSMMIVVGTPLVLRIIDMFSRNQWSPF